MTGDDLGPPPTPACLGPADLDRLAAGEPPAADESAHLTACAGCRDALDAARRDHSLLASLANAAAATTPNHPALRPARVLPPGTRLAEFTITGVLGRGGMGVVYSAQQDAPRRAVALKLVQADLASEGALHRFEHEAAALALLHHPGIAQVYSAGLAAPVEPAATAPSDPRPYIAMELVRGKPLEEFAKDGAADPLPLPDRLRLVIAVCDAADHAHRRGVIHRDLKPSNILVRDAADGAPQPTIVDFGVAKLRPDHAAGPPHSGAPHAEAMTHDGAFVGTLAFASPEQVGGDAGAIDARTDVYALGVVLYRLVTGRHPYDLGGSLADAVTTIAHARIIPPRRADPSIDAELALVVSTALAADPERRYGSAALLADDLRRYLARRPLRARGDSAAYILRKAVARHPYRAAAAALALAGVAAAGVGLAVLRMRADQAEQRQVRILDAMLASLERANEEAPGTPRLESIGDFLDVTGSNVDRLLTAYPAEHAQVLWRLARANLGQQRYAEAAEQLRRIVEVRRAAGDPLPLADALIELGRANERRGDFPAALDAFNEALDLRTRALGEADLDTTALHYYIGSALNGSKRYAEATAHFRAVADAQAAAAPDSLEHAKYLSALAASLRGEGRYEDALAAARRALDVAERAEDPPGRGKGVVFAISNVVANLITLEQFDEAERLLQRGLDLRIEHYGPQDARVASALVQIASLKLRMAGPEEADDKDPALLAAAADAASRALDLRRTIYPGDHDSIAEVLSLLGQARLEAGDPAAAEPPLREALEMRRRLPRRHGGDLGRSESLLGKCLFLAGDHAEGEHLMRSGLDRLRAAYGEDHLRTAEARDRLRRRLIAAGRDADAADPEPLTPGPGPD